MRLEKIDLIIDPEDSFSGWLHCGQLPTPAPGDLIERPGSYGFPAASCRHVPVFRCLPYEALVGGPVGRGRAKSNGIRHHLSVFVHEDPDLDRFPAGVLTPHRKI